MTEQTRPESQESTGKNGEESAEAQKRKIDNYLMLSLTLIIVAILLLTFNQRLAAGILLIAGATLIILSLRKYGDLIASVRESLNNASAANKVKEDVIADFSHRIREPLNNLVSIADMLMSAGLQKKQKDLVETLVASTDNMVNTANDLSMRSAGSLIFSPRKQIRFNILSTVQNTIDLFRLRKDTGLDFIFTKKDQHEYNCTGDPIILKQILLDLFNSIESQRRGNTAMVTITIRKERESGRGREVGFRIQTDKGIEIARRESSPGNLATRLIKLGNGESSTEIGTNYSVFSFRLPFSCPENDPKLTDSPGHGLPVPGDTIPRELGDTRILLVDDDLIHQRITLLSLGPHVKTIDTAPNGKEALEMLAVTGYDLILMDIQMPELNGLDTATKIRELEKDSGKHVPIIAITADAMLGDMEKCLAAGIDEYISKPYQPAGLIELIKKVI